MADKTIGDLTAAGALAGADLFEIEQSGNSRKVAYSAVVPIASAADWRSSEDGKVLTAGGIEDAVEAVALTDAATVAIDWSAFISADLVVTADRTLGNPTNVTPRTSRTIFITASSGTERSLSFEANYAAPLPEETVTHTVGLLLTLTALTTSLIVPTWKVVEL